MKKLLSSFVFAGAPSKQELLDDIDALRAKVAQLPDEPPPDPDPDPDPDPPPPVDHDPLTPFVVPHGATVVTSGRLQASDFVIHGHWKVRPGSEIIFSDIPIDTAADPEQFGRGLMVHEHGSVDICGTPKSSWHRSTIGLPIAATSCTLDADPLGWLIGDKLVIPDTRQKAVSQFSPDTSSQSEVVTLTAISGRELTFTPTVHSHAVGPLPELTPHVGNLTRDIVIRSENPAGTRGHVMLMAGAHAEVCHVEIRDMGRTDKGRPLDISVQRPDGSWYIARNQIGRYPWHAHKMGQLATGQVLVEGVSIHRSPGWGLTVHSTHGGIFRDIVQYDIVGAGLMTEDGSERDNLFEHILCVGIRQGWGDGGGGGAGGVVVRRDAVGKELFDLAWEGSGFWFRGLGNIVRDCVSADCAFAGANINGYYNNRLTHAQIPPPLVFEKCESYASRQGLWITFALAAGTADGPNYSVSENYVPSEFSDFTFWHIWERGIEAYHTTKHRFRRFRLLNNSAVSSLSHRTTAWPHRVNVGFYFGNPSYENGDALLDDCEIRGWNVGIACPVVGSGGENFDVIRTKLSNWVNIIATTPMVHPTAGSIPVRRRFVDCEFISGSGVGPPKPNGKHPMAETDIWMMQYIHPVVAGNGRLEFPLETVYFNEDESAPCNTQRARILGKVCPVGE